MSKSKTTSKKREWTVLAFTGRTMNSKNVHMYVRVFFVHSLKTDSLIFVARTWQDDWFFGFNFWIISSSWYAWIVKISLKVQKRNRKQFFGVKFLHISCPKSKQIFNKLRFVRMTAKTEIVVSNFECFSKIYFVYYISLYSSV